MSTLTFGVFGLQKAEVVLPLIADHLAAGETAHRNDHLACCVRLLGEKKREQLRNLDHGVDYNLAWPASHRVNSRLDENRKRNAH